MKGLKRATWYTTSAPDSCSFHSGYSAELMKNIGKITKFMVPAKFSSWRTWTDSSRPSAPSISAASAMAPVAASRCRDSKRMPKAIATSRNAAICSSDSTVPAASLQPSSQLRGSGAVSSSRITPISRSYTMASDDCMPLNSAIMASSPGAT